MTKTELVTIKVFDNEENDPYLKYEVEIFWKGCLEESWLCSDMNAVRSSVEEFLYE